VRRRTILATAAGALTVPAGCAPADLLNATIPTSGLSVQRGVRYGAAERQALDLYHPDGKGLVRPVIIFFYGGSWRTGRRGDYLFVAAALVRRGFVVAVPDYRLYPDVVFPAFLEDCAAAVAWVVAHVAKYGGDPSRVALVGHSAGAYNAVMLGLDSALLRAAGLKRESLTAVIGLAGPYDFLPITDPDIVPVFASVSDGPASQPINYVDGRNPPMLLLTGDADETVRPRNTVRLAERIQQAGGSVQAKLYPEVGHIGIVVAFAPLFRGRACVLEDVVAFAAEPRSFQG